MGFGNLHLHTYFSDGQLSPAGLAEKVDGERDLKYFAVTDHDTLAAIEPFYRAMNRLWGPAQNRKKHFIPGIELSLMDGGSGNTIHLIGYFPNITEKNAPGELTRIDSILGDFCRYRAENRAVKDVDARIIRAFELNLDGISDRFDTPETVIRLLREKAAVKNFTRFKEARKAGDVIQHPIPATYQIIVDCWEELLPDASREKAALYVLRPDLSKRERLARIYRKEGMNISKAAALAEKNQGSLVLFEQPSPLKEMDVFEGLGLLREAQAVTILAHPAVDHARISFKEFNSRILYPLIKQGLDGIEVFYPYDISYRTEAIRHYDDIARKNGLLISGGTDFHGDGRTGLSDVILGVEKVLEIIHKGSCL
jgi:predicted metal-dependent phosphoesterase TrpH